jgi:hypothetical protein
MLRRTSYPAQGDFMQTRYRFVSSVFLAAALLATPGIVVPSNPPARNGQEEHHEPEQEHRYYDHQHKDYHNWNEGEDRSYRIYLTEHHRQHVEFDRSNHSQQQAYWNWRHNHPDHN